MNASTNPGNAKAFSTRCVLGHLAQVVAVLKNNGAFVLKGEHRPDLNGHGVLGGSGNAHRVILALIVPALKTPTLGQIAVHRVVRRRLIRNDIGLEAAAGYLSKNICGVTEQAN